MTGRLYAALTAVLGALALPPTLVVAAFNRRWREGLGQRLARIPVAPRADRVVIQAASVGELITAEPLIAEVARRVGPERVVVSCLTPTGYVEARRRFAGLAVRLFPADAWPYPGRWLRRVGASRVILVETEIWPLFWLTCRRMAIPLAVVNARVSDKSFPRYRSFRPLLRPLLRIPRLAAAQNEVYRGRLTELGCPAERVVVTGNLKWDRVAVGNGEEAPVTSALRKWLGGRRLVVFASTHAAEEGATARTASAILKRFDDVAVLLASRHKERFEAAWEAWRSVLGDGARRSAGPVLDPAARWLLLDTHGELTHVFASAFAAFVGGSLAEVGGHNVLEPAAYGVPVVVGPHTRNFREEVRLLRESDALRVVANEFELTSTMTEWLAAPQSAEEAGRRGADVVAAQRGALDATVARLEAAGLLPPAPSAGGERR